MVETVINTYIHSMERMVAAGHVVGEAFVKELKTVISDISYSLGWEEAGADTLCFHSKTHSAHTVMGSRIDFSLEDLITEIFPELAYHIETPFGVYLKEDEVDKVRDALKRVKMSLV